MADTGPFFDPLEKAIRSKFIPALLGLRADEITGKYWELLMHSVMKDGLAIRNPVDMAAYVHAASKEATSHLTRSLIAGGVEFDLFLHYSTAHAAGQAVQSERLEREQQHLNA